MVVPRTDTGVRCSVTSYQDNGVKYTLSKLASDRKSEEWLMQQLTGAATQRDLNTGWRNCNMC